MSRIPVCITEPKYRMGRTTAQPSPLLLEGQHIDVDVEGKQRANQNNYKLPLFIEGSTVADAILAVGQKRGSLGKIMILILHNLKKVDILQFQ